MDKDKTMKKSPDKQGYALVAAKLLYAFAAVTKVAIAVVE
jgi:hypothetical protein